MVKELVWFAGGLLLKSSFGGKQVERQREKREEGWGGNPPPALLRYNLHTKMYIFKEYNLIAHLSGIHKEALLFSFNRVAMSSCQIS